MSYRETAGLLLAGLAFAVAPVAAEEWLSGEEFEERCRSLVESPEVPEGEACIAFVQGYLAGLNAAGDRSTAAFAQEDDGFASRAARTRASGQLQRFRTLQGAEYCVPASASGAEVIQRVTAYIAAYLDESRSGERPLELVHRALTQSFPCNND